MLGFLRERSGSWIIKIILGLIIIIFAFFFGVGGFGPKGQAFEPRTEQMRKFCSTTELMVWYLQPENQANVSAVYVHDMVFSPWDNSAQHSHP